jgi:hypothetical protein
MCWIATVSGFTHQHYTLILVSKAMRLEGGVGDSLKKQLNAGTTRSVVALKGAL